MTRVRSLLIVVVSGLTVVVGCESDVLVGDTVPRSSRAPSDDAGDGPITPLSAPQGLSEPVVELGRALFHDVRLSGDETLSCASCHDLTAGGADGRRVSRGLGGVEGRRNAPTVFNSWFNVAQLWDGRSPTLESQVDGPVHAANELGADWTEIVARLRRDPQMVRLFAAAYSGGGVTSDRIRDAIATFERSLVTLNSPFDRYLRGDEEAISEPARRGYELFVDLGCAACHQGANAGGNMFERVGVVVPLDEDEGDLGRFEVTGDDSDRYVFRVPSLRLAAITAPYFHDGRSPTLWDAIREMGWHQLGRALTDDQVALIAAFLNTLPGEHEGVALCEARCR